MYVFHSMRVMIYYGVFNAMRVSPYIDIVLTFFLQHLLLEEFKFASVTVFQQFMLKCLFSAAATD